MNILRESGKLKKAPALALILSGNKFLPKDRNRGRVV